MFSQYAGLKSYKVIELDERDDGDAIQDALGKVGSTQASTAQHSTAATGDERSDASVGCSIGH